MIDQDGPAKDIKNEEEYLDGTHERCEGIKTLGLFILSPGIHKVLQIANMKVTTETARDIARFWKVLSEVLLKVKGQK